MLPQPWAAEDLTVQLASVPKRHRACLNSRRPENIGMEDLTNKQDTNPTRTLEKDGSLSCNRCRWRFSGVSYWAVVCTNMARGSDGAPNLATMMAETVKPTMAMFGSCEYK